MTFTVTLRGSGHAFPCALDQNILAAGLAAGYMLPYNCRSGFCRTCRSQIVAGAIDYTDAPQTHYLSAEDRANGFALLCQARPCSDIIVETAEIFGMDGVRPRRAPCRIIEKTLLAPDVMLVKLRLPLNENVRYFAGQHLSFDLGDGAQREYSMAMACSAAGVTTVELHIRRYPGGMFTDRLFDSINVGTIMKIELPLGTFFLRPDDSRPLIFLATGTGFAPIKAMVEHAIATRAIANRNTTLYWGAKRREDLYLYDLAKHWAETHSGFRFVPVLSQSDRSDGWSGTTGYVQHAALADHADLSAHDVYACGSRAMIESARAAFAGLGNAAPVSFYADEFLTAADRAATA